MTFWPPFLLYVAMSQLPECRARLFFIMAETARGLYLGAVSAVFIMLYPLAGLKGYENA